MCEKLSTYFRVMTHTTRCELATNKTRHRVARRDICFKLTQHTEKHMHILVIEQKLPSEGFP